VLVYYALFMCCTELYVTEVYILCYISVACCTKCATWMYNR